MMMMMMIMCMFQSELLAEVYHQNCEPVTTMAVDKSGSAVFSGDQKGYITLWNIASSYRLHEPCCGKVREVSIKTVFFGQKPVDLMRSIHLIFLIHLKTFLFFSGL